MTALNLIILAATGGTAASDPLMQNEVGRDIVSLYMPLLLGLGLLILMVAWLPLILRRQPLSLPIICLGLGMLIFSWPPFSDYSPHPTETPVIIEKATELIVIISLMGAGLKISRPFGRDRWALPIRLLGLTMPLTILCLAFLGGWLLGLPFASALLLGACLAPTDPVLASDVQIERPANADEDEVRFALTAEAGLNDALAFPFIHLAVAASIAGFGLDVWKEWAINDIAIRCLVGIIVGIVLGKLLGKAIYKLPSDTRLSRTGDGFVALGVTLIVYALTEYLHGYGFLAVFLAGLSLRREAGDHEYNTRLHDFADETERLLMMILLVCFGGMIIGGGLLQQIEWGHVIFAVLALLVVRPFIGWLSMTGIKRSRRERFIISFFGIRGLGSVFYLAYALNHGDFGNGNDLWTVVSLVILASILMHGIAVTPMMRRLEKKRSS
ncbi:cation:proton antiporter [Parasphingorhabdus sp.]|uniref:cation:proton antiporter n=1 Tax=Parasphingorhabdus sp. TaxID=2709688 RepID=UPI0035935808